MRRDFRLDNQRFGPRRDLHDRVALCDHPTDRVDLQLIDDAGLRRPEGKADLFDDLEPRFFRRLRRPALQDASGAGLDGGIHRPGIGGGEKLLQHRPALLG